MQCVRTVSDLMHDRFISTVPLRAIVCSYPQTFVQQRSVRHVQGELLNLSLPVRPGLTALACVVCTFNTSTAVSIRDLVLPQAHWLHSTSQYAEPSVR